MTTLNMINYKLQISYNNKTELQIQYELIKIFELKYKRFLTGDSYVVMTMTTMTADTNVEDSEVLGVTSV